MIKWVYCPECDAVHRLGCSCKKNIRYLGKFHTIERARLEVERLELCGK